MKTSAKVSVVAIIIFPFITWAAFYWYAKSVEQINLEFPLKEVIQNVKNIEDIEAVKKLLITELQSRQKSLNRDASLFYSYAAMLLSLAICNSIFLFMFYRGIVHKGSNKSSNLTGANDAPSS